MHVITATNMNIVVKLDANLHGTQSHSSWQKRGQPLGQRCESPVLISKQTKQYMQRESHKGGFFLHWEQILGMARITFDVMTVMSPRVSAW
jgi:hypothetical protein